MQLGRIIRHSRRAALALLFAATLTPVASQDARSDDKAPPSLQGTWKLDESKSESLRDKIKETQGEGGPSHSGGGPHHGGGGMGGPPPGTMPGGEGSHVRVGGSMRALAQPPLLMSIDQTDTLIDFSDGARTFKQVRLGDAAPVANDISTDVMRMAGHWKSQRLIAEATGTRGGKVRETYELSSDGNMLLVTAELERPGRSPIELKRVYNRYEGE